MATATVTSKGQITIPVEVRRKMGLHEGMQVDFIEQEAGGFYIRPKTRSIKEFYGIIKTDVHATLEDMEEAIIQGAIDSATVTR
jgi:AbrB family looped-hinge helix DNA binding protein